MSLRGDHDCAVAAIGDRVLEHRRQRLDRGHRCAQQPGVGLDVGSLGGVDHAHHLVVHGAGEPGDGVRYRRRAGDHDGSGPHDGFHVDVHGALRRARHRHDNPIDTGLGQIRRVRADGDQPRGARRQGLERLHADDLTGARTADEALHPPVGEDDGAVAEVCRHRRPPRHDGRHREGLAFTRQHRNPIEECMGAEHPCHPIAARSRAARSFNGSSLPESCPWNSWAITLAGLKSRAHGPSNNEVSRSIVPSSRHEASFASRSR